MNLGRDIFRHLAPDSPWAIELARGPLEKTLRGRGAPATLITAANVLNEIKPSRDIPLQNRLAALMRRIAARLTPEGRFLAVEPGTRLGGKLMALSRQAAFGARLVPEAPCPHWGPCPMLAERATGWCHFSHLAGAAPRDLAALTKSAGLEKDNVSLSCLLLRRATPEEVSLAGTRLPELANDEFGDGSGGEVDDELFGDAALNDGPDADDGDWDAWAEAFAAIGPTSPDGGARPHIRILSDPIRLPGIAEPARYACSEKGLVLARDALRMPSGAAVAVRWPAVENRDPKTGALVVMLPSPEAEKNPARKEARKPVQRKKPVPDGNNPVPRKQTAEPGKASPPGHTAKKNPRPRAPGKRGEGHER